MNGWLHFVEGDLAYDLTYVHPVYDEIWSIYYIIMIQSSLFIQALDISEGLELDKVSLVSSKSGHPCFTPSLPLLI
jgi:hypothetical protein